MLAAGSLVQLRYVASSHLSHHFDARYAGSVITGRPPAQRNLILGLLCLASFAVVFNNLIITPILPDISDDLHVRVAIAGLLVTAYAIVGGVAAKFTRKPVAIAGLRQLLFGAVAIAATYAVGILVGAAIT